mgnify:CR=1 FL=1
MRGTLKFTFSVAVSTKFVFTSNLSFKASTTSFISISGAEAPAVIPMDFISISESQLISVALCSSYSGLFVACFGSALCCLVFLYTAVLSYALVARLHGYGDAVISA